jgi:hypothetical protein
MPWMILFSMEHGKQHGLRLMMKTDLTNFFSGCIFMA